MRAHSHWLLDRQQEAFDTLAQNADRVLVEDTRFSDTPALDRDEARRSVLEYAADLGLEVADVGAPLASCAKTQMLSIPMFRSSLSTGSLR